VGAGIFSGPRAVTVDARGNIYVADTDNNTIRKITPQHGVTTFAGKAGEAGYVDGAGVDARFNSPRGLTVDAEGNVYVADSNNAAIRKISPAGVVSTLYETPSTPKAALNASPLGRSGSISLSPGGSANLSWSTPGAELTPAKFPTLVKLTSLDLKAWGPKPGAPTYAWGNGQRHNPKLNIGGQEFADGISMIAGGPLYLNLAGGSDQFTATIGMDGTAADPGAIASLSAVFRVFGDGKMLYESMPKQRGDAPEKISVETKGVKVLALDVRTLGDYKKGNLRDADWADAIFMVAGTQPQAVDVPITAEIPNNAPEQRGLLQAFIVAGDVQLIDQDGYAAPLYRGETFTEGNTIKAGPGAQALIVFSNGTTMKVLANCSVKVTQYRQAQFNEQAEGTFLRLSRDPSRSTVVLDLLAGGLQGDVKKLNQEADSTFIINTPKGPVKEYGAFNLKAEASESPAPPTPTAT
jgi:hypothetical protein